MASATLAVMEKLGLYLKDEISELNSVYLDFPSPTQTLKYPCLTIFQNSPTYTNMMPYVITKGAQFTTGPNAGLFPVVKVVGQYEWKLQLDLWCRSKPERYNVYEKLFTVFTRESVGGLSLQLENYYNLFARYDLVGANFITAETESQKAEWRVKVDVVANCYAVTESAESLMQSIENNLETPANIGSESSGPPGGLII